MKKFPNNQQSINSNACGPISLANIYEYFGLTNISKSILDNINFESNNFSFVPQMAHHLMKNGLNVSLLSSNSLILARNWANLSKEEIINNLEERIKLNLQEWLPTAKTLIDYLNDNGKLEITNLSTYLLDEYIQKGYVLLVCLDESWIWGDRKIDKTTTFDSIRGKRNGHFIVVYGVEGSNYLVSDPYPTGLKNKNGLYPVDKNELLVSSLIWDPEIIAVNKFI